MKRNLILLFAVLLIIVYALSCMAPPGCDRSDEAIEWFHKGAVEHKNKKYEVAIEYFTKAISLDPNYAYAYYNRGSIYDELKRYNEAIADYTKAISIDPNHAKYCYERGLVYNKIEKYNKAIEDFTKAISIDKSYAESGYYNRGGAYRELGKNNEAIADYTKAISINPNRIKYYENRGLAYKAIGEKEKALGDFNMAKTVEERAKEKAKEKKRIAKEKRLKNALGKMRITKDDFEGMTWYKDKSSPQRNDANGFFLYIAKKGNGLPALRLKVQYYGSSWLFIDSFTVKADGKKYDIVGEFKKDNYIKIWEWYDSTLSANELKMIKAIIASKKATIRFYGLQYHDDKDITNKQKQALQNVLDAFEALGGHF